MFVGVVSPYDVHARAGVVDAALCVCGRAGTLLPAPLEGVGPSAIAQAIEDVPTFERLMESWRWSSALWHAGVLSPALDAGAGWPIDWVREVAKEIAEGVDGPLKRVVGESRFEDTLGYLNAICRDLTRGGADPGMSVPVTAGLSRYASSLGVVEFVGEQDSTVARLERRRTRMLGRVTVAVPRLMDGDEVIAVRERAADELEALGEALGGALVGAVEWDEAQAAADGASDSVRDAVRIVDDRAGTSMVSIGFGVCDSDVVLRAAQRASSVATRVGVRGNGRGGGVRSRSSQVRSDRVDATESGGGLVKRSVVRAVVKVLPFAVSGSEADGVRLGS